MNPESTYYNFVTVLVNMDKSMDWEFIFAAPDDGSKMLVENRIFDTFNVQNDIFSVTGSIFKFNITYRI